jgi:hypothetical protein
MLGLMARLDDIAALAPAGAISNLPLRVEMRAGKAAMSVSAFHRQFKAATSIESTVQYQKRIRLMHACSWWPRAAPWRRPRTMSATKARPGSAGKMRACSGWCRCATRRGCWRSRAMLNQRAIAPLTTGPRLTRQTGCRSGHAATDCPRRRDSGDARKYSSAASAGAAAGAPKPRRRVRPRARPAFAAL